MVSKYCCVTIPITFSRVLNSSPGCLYLHGPGFESPAHIETRVEGAWSLRLELKCDDLLSSPPARWCTAGWIRSPVWRTTW